MYCPDCGKVIDDDAIHCVHCGAKVGEEPVQAQQPVYVVQPQQQTVYVVPQEEPKPKDNIFAIVALIASCLGIVSLGLTCIVGIVFGYLGLSEAKKTGKGKGMSKAGIIVGFIGVGLIVASIVLPIVVYLLYMLVMVIVLVIIPMFSETAFVAMNFIPML